MLTFSRSIEPSKGPQNKVFNVNLNLPDGQETSTLTLIHYFIPDNLMNAVESMHDFNFKQALIVATISAMPPNGPTQFSITTGDITSWADYAFIGDILQVSGHLFNHYNPILMKITSSYLLMTLTMIMNHTLLFLALLSIATKTKAPSTFNPHNISNYCMETLTFPLISPFQTQNVGQIKNLCLPLALPSQLEDF